jgi:hypothetical protein
MALIFFLIIKFLIMKRDSCLLSFIIFVFSQLVVLNLQAQTYNLISTGNMESGGWTAIPRNTNLISAYDAATGIDSTKSLKLTTSNMGGDNYYMLRCEQLFHLTKSQKITVSFWAKGSSANIRLQPWIQESDGLEWMNMGDAYLGTGWRKYRFTAIITTQTSDNYKLKFRGYNTGTIYIDNVEIGPVDYEDVVQSGIYDVTVSQNNKLWPLNVFQNACPVYSAGYQNMQTKDKHPLELFAGRTINWTKLSCTYPITVHVKVTNTQKVPVTGQTVRILPSRFGITSTTEGNTITFTINEPGQYSVEIGDDGYKNGLMFFADPVEADIPSQADPDYLVLYNASSSDLASIPSSYSGIYFRRGVHDIGIFNVPSHIKNIYFEDGSWVYGALQLSGNPNVRIYGRGILSSYKFNYRQTHCVNAESGSNNIQIEGLVVADPKYFGIRLVGTHNNISFTKVIGGWVYNCDGISAFAGSKVSKCFIWANDDAIKAYRDSLAWSDIVCWQLNNGAIIQTSWGGASGGSTSRGVTIRRVDVLHAEWDVDRFNVGLLGCVGNHYKVDMTKSDLLQDWLIEDVVTENKIPLVFNITPERASTHVHIHGMTLRNWDVHQDNSLGFVNEIKGEDVNDYFSGFVFDSVRYNNGMMTNENRITTGEMDNSSWTSAPNGTDQVVSLGPTFGTGGGWGLRSVTTDMNGKSSYVIKCTQPFHIDNNEVITVSYWARATAAGKLIQPFVQDAISHDYKYFTEESLTTNFQRYSSTFTVDKTTSDHYQIKFKLYSTAWVFLDKVQIGRKDWLTLTEIKKQYLNTPTFIPDLNAMNAAQQETRSPVIAPLSSANSNKAPEGDFTIYPNPVSDILHIAGGDGQTPYMVYDNRGNLRLKGRGNSVNVSTLHTGIYILFIENKIKIKFIKK